MGKGKKRREMAECVFFPILGHFLTAFENMRLILTHSVYLEINSCLLKLTMLGMTNAEVLHQVDHGYRMQAPQGCPPLLYDIMLECWHKVPFFCVLYSTCQEATLVAM